MRHFRDSDALPNLKVPHIGWNGLKFSGEHASCVLEGLQTEDKVYFVHSFRVVPEPANAAWTLTTTSYSGHDFVSSVQKGNVVATQFHPEKSGAVGLQLLGRFLNQHAQVTPLPICALNFIFLRPVQVFKLLVPVMVFLCTLCCIQATVVAPRTYIAVEGSTGLAKRVLACLDVRSNDAGDLVVTKGDQVCISRALLAS